LKGLLNFLTCLFLVTCCSSAFTQSVTTVETYGPVPATQPYSGLGTNITTPTNAWEYADAEAAHITWARFDCNWIRAEIQEMPANTSGGYKLPSECSAGLGSSKAYDLHPMLNALYGPPYSAIVTGTAASAVTVGETTVSINVTSGSLADVVPGSTFLAIGSGYLSAKYSYPGVLITSVSGSTLTLASAATTTLAQGATVTLNIVLYPPVIIAPGGNYLNNTSVQAFGNYASYIAQQVAAIGLTGTVSIWNEPTWCCDKWDHGVALYDNPPVNGDISSSLGVELPLYVSTLKSVPGVPFDNGYTETAMWPGSLFYPATFLNVQNLSNLQSAFGSESFHVYGNNPEDYIWNPTCVGANATAALVSNILSGSCTPVGLWTGASDSAAVASQSFPNTQGGIKHGISEAGICRSCTGATETQVSRFDLRLFLSEQALGVSPVMFYLMSGETDWEWVDSSQTPYPVYTAFKGLMTDIGTIAQPPVTPCPACATPSVSSYKGYFPLATVTFVGSRPGDNVNSILYYTWQRTYGTKWTAVASPATVPVSVSVPSGMTVTSVKDTVTAATVAFTFSGGTLVYQVADDPIEVLLTPAASISSQQTITFPAIASRSYGSAPFTVGATSSLGSSYPVTIAVQSGPATISGNTVTLTGVGTVVLKASQAGDGQHSPATATQSFQVTPAPLTVTAKNATRVYGAANPVFSGTIAGAVNGDTFTETFTTTATASSNPGTYPIVPAVTGADLTDYTITTVDGTLTVSASTTPTTVATTTKITAPSTAIYGSAVPLSAAVTSTSGTPTGTVTFYTGTTSLGIGTLNGGVATLSTTALPLGTDSVTAVYAGLGNFAGSTAPALTVTVALAVGATATALNAPPSAAFGTTITLTAAVSASSGTPTGTVTFYYGTTPLGTGTLNGSGVATLGTKALPVGADSVSAVYGGSKNFTGSTSPTVKVAVTSVLGATTTTLNAPSSASSGTAVALTAAVSAASGSPSGTVTFYNGTVVLGTGTLNASGVATLSTTTLPVGVDSVTAVYAGAGTFAGSTSGAVTITIASPIPAGQASYTVAANPTTLTLAQGQAANTTVILTPMGGYSGNIVLGCVNLPASMVCSFAQNQVTLSGSKAANLVLTIKLSPQATGSIGSAGTPLSPLGSTWMAVVFWWPGGLTGLAAFAGGLKRRTISSALRLPLMAVGALAFTAGLAGCGFSGTATPPVGASQVTVFATGSSATAVTTQVVVLTVNAPE
jgi:hypothetical protein